MSFFNEISRDVSLNAAIFPTLTELGQKVYQKGANPSFRLTCGDRVITGYQEKATLTMSVNMEFASHMQKDTFKTELSLGFGFYDISMAIQRVATRTNISAKVSVNIYQEGGDPTQLGKVFEKDRTGSYYFLKCNIQDMASCQKYVDGLIDYAKNDFPKQIDGRTGKGFSPGGTVTTVSAATLGITIAPSFLTPQINAARIALSKQYFFNDYYNQKLFLLVKSYPVEWIQSSSIYGTLAAFYRVAEGNIEILMGQEGGIQCYDDVVNCPALAGALTAQLSTID